MYNLSVCRRTSHYLSAVLAPLLAACLFAPGTASALDFNVQPRINTGLMYYDFTQDPFAELQVQGATFTPSTATTEYSVSDLMPLVGGGATVFTGRFYLDVYAQKAFAGSDDAAQGFISPAAGGFTVLEQFDSDWDREEYSVSFGYRITDNLALYTGYRLSDTEFEQEGGIIQTGLPALPRELDANRTRDFEQDGPFIGGTYGFRIGDTGTIGLNLAIAFVEGDIEDTLELRFGGEDVGNRFENDFTGDTLGTTIGLSWTAPLPIYQGFNYSIGLDGYQYSFEADEDANIGDVSETVIRGTAGVSYVF